MSPPSPSSTVTMSPLGRLYAIKVLIPAFVVPPVVSCFFPILPSFYAKRSDFTSQCSACRAPWTPILVLRKS